MTTVPCQCIYREDVEHLECERDNATMLLDTTALNVSTIAMCRWCATDWVRRHPYMSAVEVTP